ncbi:unnamed protein product [Blepharisma stoltei]|uniref:AMP-activated protein kinase glycogen-binding domain-containing protein n=1 Tax=Blepharisma stoltei TaxID=1481888 RepID=A0AAU9K2E9_9CILI|nr:unnamed protein product [Blepharisma stoltei]
MKRVKINSSIFNIIALKDNPKIGFCCLLDISSPSFLYGISQEINLSCHFEEQKIAQAKDLSARIIQRHIKSYLLRKGIQNRIIHKNNLIKHTAATKIQCLFRSWISRKKFYFLLIVRKIQKIRNKAASIIQKNFRLKILPSRLHFTAKVAILVKVRKSAAILIQKHVKGFLIRKDLPFMRIQGKERLIRWRSPANSVTMTGDFMLPPWEHEIPMFYSKILHEFYTMFFMENNLKTGDYRIKFNVDGNFVCDWRFPVINDEFGNYNNKIYLNYGNKGCNAESSMESSENVFCIDLASFKDTQKNSARPSTPGSESTTCGDNWD